MFSEGGDSYIMIKRFILHNNLIHSIISIKSGNGKFDLVIIVTFSPPHPFPSPSSLSSLLLSENKLSHQFLIAIFTFCKGRGVYFLVV